VKRLAARRGTKVVVFDVVGLSFEGGASSVPSFLPEEVLKRWRDAGDNVRFYKVDLSSPEAVKKAAEEVVKEVGHP
jgi:NAD(P)-dependent dehydrogenase (short-subunit alcohol dehydrogenase family)